MHSISFRLKILQQRFVLASKICCTRIIILCNIFCLLHAFTSKSYRTTAIITDPFDTAKKVLKASGFELCTCGFELLTLLFARLMQPLTLKCHFFTVFLALKCQEPSPTLMQISTFTYLHVALEGCATLAKMADATPHSDL